MKGRRAGTLIGVLSGIVIVGPAGYAAGGLTAAGADTSRHAPVVLVHGHAEHATATHPSRHQVDAAPMNGGASWVAGGSSFDPSESDHEGRSQESDDHESDDHESDDAGSGGFQSWSFGGDQGGD
jgi:hypothetical protein